MSRSPFTYQNLLDIFKDNPEGLLVTAFYFSFESRIVGIDRLESDITALTLQDERGAVSALADIHNALSKTTDNEYNWIRNKLGHFEIKKRGL